MNYRWIYRESIDEVAVHEITDKLSVPSSIARVLVGRGLQTLDAVNDFFKPSKSEIHSPWLMDGMKLAVDRIVDALEAKEMMWVHGDYDVDGTTSTAMMLHFIKSVGGVAQYHIPNRLDEGFGFTAGSVNLAKEAGAKLIITVDVGITAVKAVSLAASYGIDVIICDHHQAAEELPEAVAILDPIKPGCQYPFKHLAACGVAYKLIQAVCERLDIGKSGSDYLDFVAIASAADIAPIEGENRIFSYFGLQKLNRSPRPGLKGLIDCAGLTVGQLNNASVVFGLAPRINAAGRLGDASRAVEMMIQEDEWKAFNIAQELEHDNRKRRVIDEETFESASIGAEKFLADTTNRSLILHQGEWHAGVIGIVASRLVEKYRVPTVLMTTVNGVAKGSARSVRDFDIHNALKQCEDLIIEFGGHKHAAGLSLKIENVPELRRRFNEIAKLHMSDDMLTPEIQVDAELQLTELSPKFLEYLAKFAPFGQGNLRPVFVTRNVVSANGVKVVGNNHLKFRALQNNFAIDAIGFNLGHKIAECSHGKPFSVVYTIEENLFNGKSSPQIRIKDVKPE
ncbi:MAG: single-stranded-DNA-specific exonuclease RecJ [Ignavibacteria bacterium]|nr:single-stranded-DNA-specific exonuclease RecJ [Ignavibacteria bacterium]